MKCSLVLLAAMAVAILFYYGLDLLVGNLLEEYLQTSVYMERATDRAADKLQKYVAKNEIASDDKEGLNKWSRDHMLVYYTVLVDGRVTYASYLANGGIIAESEEDIAAFEAGSTYLTEEDFGAGERKYEVEFADGTGQVYLQGLFEYQFYLIAHYTELFLSALLFLSVFLVFLQKKLKYVHQLESEVKILEGGGLDKEITVAGMDELSELAYGLDQMRLNLKESMNEKEELLKANNSLVTGMAHDLRTPLTSLLLYTELLSKKKYTDEKEMELYLEKTALKAIQIKHMSDQLFERFYIAQDEEVLLEPPCSLRSVLEERLSDLVMFLESQGFFVECSIHWPDVKLSVVSEYMDRILDNIASNLQKYADAAVPVKMDMKLILAQESHMEEEKSCVRLRIRNKRKACCDKVESTNLGVANMQQMVGKMNGKCMAKEEGDAYEIRIFLPVIS